MAELLMRLVMDKFTGGFRIDGRLANNLRYADDSGLVASSDTELQEVVTRYTT